MGSKEHSVQTPQLAPQEPGTPQGGGRAPGSHAPKPAHKNRPSNCSPRAGSVRTDWGPQRCADKREGTEGADCRDASTPTRRNLEGRALPCRGTRSWQAHAQSRRMSPGLAAREAEGARETSGDPGTPALPAQRTFLRVWWHAESASLPSPGREAQKVVGVEAPHGGGGCPLALPSPHSNRECRAGSAGHRWGGGLAVRPRGLRSQVDEQASRAASAACGPQCFYMRTKSSHLCHQIFFKPW